MELPDFLTLWPYHEIVLTGHRIGLYTVIRHYQEGWSAEQIVEEYPSLDLEHVKRVIGFYLGNRDEVDAYVADYAAEIQRQASQPRRGPTMEELRRRWRAKGLGEPP
jgi:uncharacterized protein (DUF433 family)